MEEEIIALKRELLEQNEKEEAKIKNFKEIMGSPYQNFQTMKEAREASDKLLFET